MAHASRPSTPSKRRGRPPSFDRRAALDAATALFWRYGYDGTSIAVLTEAMGCTPPTLYAAFGSKAQLYREVLTHYRDRNFQDGERQVSPPALPAHSHHGEPPERQHLRARPACYRTVERGLRAAAVRFAASGAPKGCLVTVGALQCGAENRAAADATAAVRTDQLAAFVAELERAKRDGELPADTDADAVARFYAAVAQGMAVQAIDGADAARLHALVDLALAAWPVVTARPRPDPRPEATPDA